MAEGLQGGERWLEVPGRRLISTLSAEVHRPGGQTGAARLVAFLRRDHPLEKR